MIDSRFFYVYTRYNSYISLERFFMKSRKLTKLNTYYFSYFR